MSFIDTQASRYHPGDLAPSVPIDDYGTPAFIPGDLGKIIELHVTDGGRDYVVGDLITFTEDVPMGGADGAAHVTEVDSNGTIVGVSSRFGAGVVIDDPGHDYVSGVRMNFGASAGVDATGYAIIGSCTGTQAWAKLCCFDFQYGEKKFRFDDHETLRPSRFVKVAYTNVDGQQVRIEEATSRYWNAVGRLPAAPCDNQGGFFFADGGFRELSVDQFAIAQLKITEHEAVGTGGYSVATTVHSLIGGDVDRVFQVVPGKIPLAPTRRSALTAFVQSAYTSVITDDCVTQDFVQSARTAIDLPWAEDQSDVQRAATRRMQRATAIPRQVTLRANPLMKVGQTLRLIDATRGLDSKHLIVGRRITMDPSGGAMMELDLECWVR